MSSSASIRCIILLAGRIATADVMVIILTGRRGPGPSWITVTFFTEAPGSGSPRRIFTHSIDVCAVAGTGHALYRDVRLSGNRVRGSWVGRPSRRARGA